MEASPNKRKRKSEDQETENSLLDGFQIKKILMNDVKSKKVHILGKII